MLFVVLPNSTYPAPAAGQAYLIRDDWDDWFQFETQFSLVVFDATEQRYDLGRVKIGQRGLKGAQRDGDLRERIPNVPATFDALSSDFFSLGQEENYYETMWSLDESLRVALLHGMRDVAFDLSLFDVFHDEAVMQASLLREISDNTVRFRFARIVRGDARLTAFNFHYQISSLPGGVAPVLAFEVVPGSRPPTNVHVLIGRNGVGKTTCLQHMSRALVQRNADPAEVGTFMSTDGVSVESGQIVGLVSVSFSAFDPFGPVRNRDDRLRYTYVGLKTEDSRREHDDAKSVDELAQDFVESVKSCRNSARSERWLAALRTLESDDIFQSADLSSLAAADESTVAERARHIYERLSSGHKIVLLTITRLVETVDERTLVLVDEPEAHLHPPLLAAFVRSLSDLLLSRNGVAIVATHSPVVLQEAPRSCVWILHRTGAFVAAERPTVETFGENVGVLTREVFGLEVTRSGHHQLLVEAVAQLGDFDRIVASFGGQLGAEARAIISGLLAAQRSSREA